MSSKGKQVAKKTVNLLLNALIFIFGFILLISIYTGVQTRILGNAYTNFFGYSIFEVQTGSMAETINAGDCIIVSLTKKVKLNDIVTYKSGNDYITHRIIEVYNGTYVTKGDANNAKDKPIDQNQIIGKVVGIWSNFGILRKTLFNPSVLIALIITLFLFNLAFKKNKSGNDNKFLNTIINNSKVKSLIGKIVGNKFVPTLKKKTKKDIKNIKSNESNDNSLGIWDEEQIPNNHKNEHPIEDSKDNSHKDILEKTSLYRVISIDPNEVNDKYEEQVPKIDKNDLKSVVKDKDIDKISIFETIPVDSDTTEHKDELPIIKEEKIENPEYYHDTDLEKTSFYRVISVDAKEVDEKYKELAPKVKIEEVKEPEEHLDEELEKTSLYRFISVDAKEVDDTLLEIAQNEIKGTDSNDKNKKQEEVNAPKEIAEEEEENNDLTQIDLELLDKLKNSLKGKNIIDTIMNIRREEISEIADLLYNDEKIRFSKNSIKKAFITTCIDGKYYNYYDDISTTGKNVLLKLENAIKKTANSLIKEYKGNDQKYNEVVNLYAKTFILIINLEKAKDSITTLKVKHEFYKKELIKYSSDWNGQNIDQIANEIIKIQRNYNDMGEYYLAKLETNMFNLTLNKLTTKKDIYGLKLEHNITFSKIYSDYIIDKTYKEGIVAEDKIVVLLNLLLVQLCKDMMLGTFNKKYILYIPNSLYTKERKLEKLLKMLDDKYAKENVIILLTYNDLLSNKKILKEIKQMDYKFAIVFDKESSVEEKDRGNIYIADYIFMNKKIVSTTKILQCIPEELISRIIYEDINDKVGDVGGE